MTQPSNSILFWVRKGNDLEHLFRFYCIPRDEERPYEQTFDGLSSSWTSGTPESAVRLGRLFLQQCKSVQFQHQPPSGESPATWVFTTPTLTLSVSREGHGIVCTISNWSNPETLEQAVNIIDNIVTMASVRKGGEPQDLRISNVIPFLRSKEVQEKQGRTVREKRRKKQPAGAV